MLVMVVFFIAFRWIHLSTPLIRLFLLVLILLFFFSSRRRHTRCGRDWSSDVCSSDLNLPATGLKEEIDLVHFPGVIKDHEPHYFGLVLTGINEQQFATQYGLFAPFHDYYQESCDKLIQNFLARGSKPSLVLLKKESPFADVFEIIAKQTDIKFKKCDELPYISELIDSVEEEMCDEEFY